MSLAMATSWRPCGHSGLRAVITQATMPTSLRAGGRLVGTSGMEGVR